MTQPIDPSTVTQKKAERIPARVIEIFNDLIIENWNGHHAHVNQYDVVSRICAALETDRFTVFNRHYLDIESTFEAAGWAVEHVKPGYNEPYQAYFQFSKK